MADRRKLKINLGKSSRLWNDWFSDDGWGNHQTERHCAGIVAVLFLGLLLLWVALIASEAHVNLWWIVALIWVMHIILASLELPWQEFSVDENDCPWEGRNGGQRG